MNVDEVFNTFNRHGVAYLLIGGMNFLLRHEPVLTFDIDVWISDTEENRQRCERALVELDAEWGAGDEDWGPVADKAPGWLGQQPLFCLTSPHGAIDIFRRVKGLASWQESFERAEPETTADGATYRGLSDDDMLACQYALDEPQRKPARISALTKALQREESCE